MKEFQVTKVVNDYTSEELARFREQFAPTIERFRRRRRYYLWVFFPIIIAISLLLIIEIGALEHRPDFTTNRFLHCTIIFIFLLLFALSYFGFFFGVLMLPD
jgi:hypothetical protein